MTVFILAGTPGLDWVKQALVESNLDLFDLPHLHDFLPNIVAAKDDGNRRAWVSDAPLEAIERMLLAILGLYSKQNGATLINIHLKRDTSIASSFSEGESWELVKKVCQARCNIIVCVGTRSFSYKVRACWLLLWPSLRQ